MCIQIPLVRNFLSIIARIFSFFSQHSDNSDQFIMILPFMLQFLKFKLCLNLDSYFSHSIFVSNLR